MNSNGEMPKQAHPLLTSFELHKNKLLLYRQSTTDDMS